MQKIKTIAQDQKLELSGMRAGAFQQVIHEMAEGAIVTEALASGGYSRVVLYGRKM